MNKIILKKSILSLLTFSGLSLQAQNVRISVKNIAGIWHLSMQRAFGQTAFMVSHNHDFNIYDKPGISAHHVDQ